MEVKQLDTDCLKPWDKNPRKNDHAVDAVATSIKEFGFNVPILCDQHNTVIAGHTRWKAAKRLGLGQVPVITLEMTDTQRRAFAIVDNKTAEIADWDNRKLQDILEQLQQEDVDLASLGFTDAELRKLLDMGETEAEDRLPDLPDKRTTVKGDVWQLGRHRLICGDSMDPEAVALLLDGVAVEHVFAGPPYFNQREYSQWSNYAAHLADMARIVDNCVRVLKPGGVLVWNIGNGSASGHDHTSHHSRLLEDAGLRYVDTIAWVKSSANFSVPRNAHIRRNRYYYPAFQWEALLVFQKPGAGMPRMSREGAAYMSECQTNVWEVPAVTDQDAKFGHPAVCPVEIPYRSLMAYTDSGETVFEAFGGSGTTLIAAEKASRNAMLIEQHPRYCDLIVKRWEALTGMSAERERACSGNGV